MILQTIKCNVKKCERTYTETKDNEGFPGWGHVAGLRDDATNETIAHLCPEHLKKVSEVLNNDMG